MKNWKEIISHETFRYIDHSSEAIFDGVPYEALTSFAVDDALALSVSGDKSPPAMRVWVHPKTIVLGIPDGRLPYLTEGVHYLQKEGYKVVIRNSGGLAVALDEGVINLSLVVPGVRDLSIHDCYEAMVSFVQYMFRDMTDKIEAFEVVGSYCPGDYDLSIDGRKFAGISQRRVKDGVAVQIYLDVNGNSRERASVIREFYRLGKKDADTRFDYPVVNPDVMGSLSELLQIELTMDEMKQRIYRTLDEFTDSIISGDFSDEEIADFRKRYEQMVKRNQPIHSIAE